APPGSRYAGRGPMGSRVETGRRSRPVRSGERSPMRTFALPTLLLTLTACGTTRQEENTFAQPNALMGAEIRERVDQIQYQHRDELLNSLLWLAQSGEQAIPALLDGLRHAQPKVRSNCAWVLAQIGDRRVIPSLQPLSADRS